MNQFKNPWAGMVKSNTAYFKTGNLSLYKYELLLINIIQMLIVLSKRE